MLDFIHQNLASLTPLLWGVAVVSILLIAALIFWLRKRGFTITEIGGKWGPLSFKAEPEEENKQSEDGQGEAAAPPPGSIGEVNISGDGQIQTAPGGRQVQTGEYYEGGQHDHYHLQERAQAASIGGLPRPRVARFVDRGAIMDDLRAALRKREKAAIAGVGGMGGIGKTELALHLAGELEGEQTGSTLWVTLADRSLEAVQTQMGLALGVQFPPGADAHGRAAVIRAKLEQEPRAVFLDDVRRPFTSQLHLCLPPANCPTLITSRLHHLPGLPTGAIRNLNLMTEAQAQALLEGIPGLTGPLGAEPGAAKELIEACGCHPLALDLAAHRLRNRLNRPKPVRAFVNQLQDRLKGLARGQGRLDSLAANFELSYAELSPADRKRFRTLAVFGPTGFTPDAAAAVWDDPAGEAENALARLENASLVGPAPAPDRYLLHDLLGEFAGRKLGEAGEQDQACGKMAAHLIALFSRHFTDDPSNAPHLTLEVDNLRAAAAWALTQQDGDLLGQLAYQARNWLHVVFNLHDEWEAWLRSALVQFGIEEQGLEANVLKAIGDIQQFRDDRDAALESYQAALDRFRAIGDKLGEANVLKAIGDIQQFRDDRDAALESYQAALDRFRAIGSQLGEANVLKAIGDIQQFRDDRDAALESYQAALDRFRAIGDKLGEANVLMAIGDIQQFRDDRDAALESYQAALDRFRAIGSQLGEANVLMAIGDIQQFRDDRDAALESYQAALDRFRAIGDKLGEANVLMAIGDIQQFRDDRDAALESYQAALDRFRAIGDKLGEANVLKAIGDIQQFRDDRDAALESYQAALDRFRAIGSQLGEANVLKAIGDIQQFRDDRDAALESYQAALDRFRAIGDKLGEANVLKAIGDIQQFRDDRDAALESYQAALDRFRAIGDHNSAKPTCLRPSATSSSFAMTATPPWRATKRPWIASAPSAITTRRSQRAAL